MERNRTKVALLSVKPKFVESILAGTKRIEFRKTWPENVAAVLMYSSSPVQRIVAAVRVRKVLQGTPELIWEKCGKFGGITEPEFQSYFAGKDKAVGIILDKPLPFRQQIKTDILDLRVAQSYRYVTQAEWARLRDIQRQQRSSESR